MAEAFLVMEHKDSDSEPLAIYTTLEMALEACKSLRPDAFPFVKAEHPTIVGIFRIKPKGFVYPTTILSVQRIAMDPAKLMPVFRFS